MTVCAWSRAATRGQTISQRSEGNANINETKSFCGWAVGPLSGLAASKFANSEAHWLDDAGQRPTPARFKSAKRTAFPVNSDKGIETKAKGGFVEALSKPLNPLRGCQVSGLP
jgi:hypothetical protein